MRMRILTRLRASENALNGPFLDGQIPREFREGKRPIKTFRETAVEVGKRPIKDGKRPINLRLVGCLLGTPPRVENGPSEATN